MYGVSYAQEISYQQNLKQNVQQTQQVSDSVPEQNVIGTLISVLKSYLKSINSEQEVIRLLSICTKAVCRLIGRPLRDACRFMALKRWYPESTKSLRPIHVMRCLWQKTC